jgi:hypothetical protein
VSEKLGKVQPCATCILMILLTLLSYNVHAISARGQRTPITLTPFPGMQLSQSDELYSVQKLLWSSIGLPAAAQPADLQKADLPSCLAAARAVCLQRVSWLLQTQQQLSSRVIQQYASACIKGYDRLSYVTSSSSSSSSRPS